MRSLVGVAVVIALLTATPRAQASGEESYGYALLALAALSIVSPIGAMVKTIEAEPSKTWGRLSLASGAVNASLGTGLLIASAIVDDEDDETVLQIVGGITLGVGVNGLIWGIASEATLPEEDPGIAASPRPGGATVMLGGRF